MNNNILEQELIGRLEDEMLDVRAKCREVSSVMIPYSGGAIGTIKGTLFQSSDDQDRGGIVLRVTLENGASSFFPHVKQIEIKDSTIGGIEIHMAGEVEAEAFLDVLRSLLVREVSSTKELEAQITTAVPIP